MYFFVNTLNCLKFLTSVYLILIFFYFFPPVKIFYGIIMEGYKIIKISLFVIKNNFFNIMIIIIIFYL
jgi:hypothetical protein